MLLFGVTRLHDGSIISYTNHSKPYLTLLEYISAVQKSYTFTTKHQGSSSNRATDGVFFSAEHNSKEMRYWTEPFNKTRSFPGKRVSQTHFQLNVVSWNLCWVKMTKMYTPVKQVEGNGTCCRISAATNDFGFLVLLLDSEFVIPALPF